MERLDFGVELHRYIELNTRDGVPAVYTGDVFIQFPTPKLKLCSSGSIRRMRCVRKYKFK
jgi:hypothetical protein